MVEYGSEVYHDYSMPVQIEKKGIATAKTISEAEREVKVIRETDVIVVGGGPGGIAAAVSAARSGAGTILIERYGHLGGMSTGGLVNIIPNLSDIYGEQLIGGFCQEVIDRLAARGAACFPEKRFWGKSEKEVVDTYLKANMMHFYIRKNKEGKYVVLYTAVIDPEVAKDEMNTLVLEAGAELLLHTWVTEPIMEGNTVKGVIVENKSGRQALLGKVVIDCTGDGDLLPGTGTETTDYMVPGSRIAQFGFVYWLANVDLKKYDDFVNSEPEKYEEVTLEIIDMGGWPYFCRGLLKQQEGVVWIHRLIGSLHPTDADEMTYVDVKTRNQSVRTWELLRKYMPGFEKASSCLQRRSLAPPEGAESSANIFGPQRT